MASPTTNKGYTYAAHGGSVGAWDTQLNGNFEYQDLNLGGYYSITASSSITVANTFNSTFATIASTARSVTIPTSIAQNLFYNVLGTLQSSLAINMPAAGSIYVFGNGLTTGSSYALVAGPTGGTTITLPSGGQVIAVMNSSAAYYAQNRLDASADIVVNSVTASSSVSAQSITASSAISGQSLAISSAATVQSVTASSAVSGAIASGAMIASSATQVTGTSTTTLVAPAYQQYHESTCKAWVSFNSTGSTIVDSYNVTSVNRSGTGTYQMNFTNKFTNNDYVVSGISRHSANSTFICVTSQSTNQVSFKAVNTGGTPEDPTGIMIACFGTLA